MRFIIVLFVLLSVASKAQCDHSNIYLSGGSDISGALMMDYCPRVSYAFDVDTSENLHSQLLFKHISQLPKNLLPIITKAEKQLESRVAIPIFKKLTLEQVDIKYYDPAIDTTTDKWNLLFGSNDCKPKYVLFYSYKYDSFFAYTFSIALDSAGNIISSLKLPSQFKGLPKGVNICNIIAIAKKTKRDIGTIESIVFDYNDKTKRFVWNVFPTLKNGKIGSNELKYVQIDAADIRRIQILKSTVEIMPAIE